MFKTMHRLGRQPMVTPQATALAAGETLNALAERITRQHGALESVALTTMAMYVAVKKDSGEVSALIIPYAVDFKTPAPRDFRYGVYSEASNPDWAYAPPSILNRLTPAQTPEAAEWRKRCWENQQMRTLDPQVWQRGDVLNVKQPLASNVGVQAPGYYVLLESLQDFSKIQRLRDQHGTPDSGTRAAIVKGLASAAEKLPLTPDPTLTLARNPTISGFSVVRVMADSEYGSHYVMLGRTVQGAIVPLAKADADEREGMIARVMDVAKVRSEMIRDFEKSDIYAYARRHGLTDIVVEQQVTGRASLLDNLEVHVAPLASRELDRIDPAPSL